MTKPDAFDPTHALDGWRLPAPAAVDLSLAPLARGGAPLPWVHAVPEAFDPTHALDGWRAPAPAPLDLELRSLRTKAAPPDAAKTAWLKKRGYTMGDVEDVDMPAAPRRAVVAQAPAPPPVDAHAPVLDLPARAPDPRLLTQWQPQAWVAQVRRSASASVEVHPAADGPRVDHRPPQWLCALWAPSPAGAPRLARWPQLATLVSADTADAALAQLLPKLPHGAALWRADERDADWALLADLVLQQDTGLAPWQAQGLRALAAAERSATLRHMADAYRADGGLARRRA